MRSSPWVPGSFIPRGLPQPVRAAAVPVPCQSWVAGGARQPRHPAGSQGAAQCRRRAWSAELPIRARRGGRHSLGGRRGGGGGGAAAQAEDTQAVEARSAGLSMVITVADAQLGEPTTDGRIVSHLTLDVTLRSTTDIQLRQADPGFTNHWINVTPPGTGFPIQPERGLGLPTHIPAGSDETYRLEVPIDALRLEPAEDTRPGHGLPAVPRGERRCPGIAAHVRDPYLVHRSRCTGGVRSLGATARVSPEAYLRPGVRTLTNGVRPRSSVDRAGAF